MKYPLACIWLSIVLRIFSQFICAVLFLIMFYFWMMKIPPKPTFKSKKKMVQSFYHCFERKVVNSEHHYLYFLKPTHFPPQQIISWRSSCQDLVSSIHRNHICFHAFGNPRAYSFWHLIFLGRRPLKPSGRQVSGSSRESALSYSSPFPRRLQPRSHILYWLT